MRPTRTVTTTFLFLAALGLQAQWTPMESGLLSSRSLTVQDGDLFVATYPSGVRKSSDDGATWTLVNTGLPQTGNSFFVRSVGSNAEYLFAGTHSGIYRSSNGGASWSDVNGSLTATDMVYANKFFQFDNITFAVFAGSVGNGGGIARSNNNGDSWFIGHSGMGSNVVVYHLISQGGTLYAATSTGLYTSSDLGLQWTVQSGTNFSVYALAPQGDRLIASTPFGMRWSSNNGATWTDASGGVGNPSRAEMAVLDGGVYVHGTVQGSGTGCFRSTDNGSTWSPFNMDFSDTDEGSLEQYHLAGNKLYVCALFDIYSITGTGTGITTAERIQASAHPSPFVHDFILTLGEEARGSMLVMTDVSGREIRRQANLRPGANVIGREGLPAGLYHCYLELPGSAGRQYLGGMVAQ